MATTLRVAHYVHHSLVDGPGARAVLFLHGCPIRCPACQSPGLWDYDGGFEVDVEAVAAELLDTGLPVTISGGEPFAQPEGVAGLLARLRVQRPKLHVIVYSGFVLEDILEMSEAIPAMRGILDLADVLVDGPYIPDLDHDWVQWRGSANQRPIDLRASVFTGIVHRLVELDWCSGQVITVTGEGDLVGTAGAMRELFGEDLAPSRMCGQATEVTR